jgi:hypothetical protein
VATIAGLAAIAVERRLERLDPLAYVSPSMAWECYIALSTTVPEDRRVVVGEIECPVELFPLVH